MNLNGQMFFFGDQIDTDRMLPGKYTKTLNVDDLVAHLFEDVDPSFAAQVQAGAIIVAGKNFGCGSSREIAPYALKKAGVSCIIAKSFARIFFRNALNLGLNILEIPEHQIREGSKLKMDDETSTLNDQTYGKSYSLPPQPRIIQAIISAGGLVPFVQQYGSYDAFLNLKKV